MAHYSWGGAGLSRFLLPLANPDPPPPPPAAPRRPMFGCTDGSQVLKEVASCIKSFPDAYIRLVAFDAQRQVQITGFLVHRPASAKDYKPTTERSL